MDDVEAQEWFMGLSAKDQEAVVTIMDEFDCDLAGAVMPFMHYKQGYSRTEHDAYGDGDST